MTGSALSAAPASQTSSSSKTERRPAPLTLLVFATGTASLGSEIAAARLMAPFFGASTIVWANTIAVCLLALSIGYWFGGRMADRRPTQAALSRCVLAAAVLLGLVPIVARPLLDVSISAFDSISIGAFAGSLFGTLALIAVPLLLLGAVSPWALRLRLDAVDDAGEVAGRLYAISTVGSLVGTFLSSLLLIPLVGTQRTFIVFGLVIALVAVAGLGWRAWLVPAILAGALALPVGTTKDTEGSRVLHEAETTYQYARVIEKDDGTRELELNEGQAIHSLARPGTVLTGSYWDGFLVEPLAALGRPPRSVAILGNAAGTMARAYGEYFPSTDVDAVEIDGELTDIGRRWFGLRDRPGLRLITADARPFLRRTDRRYDAIFVDAYRQPYIPFYLSTREFFRLVADHLNPGGLVVVNAGHPEDSDVLEQTLTATMRSAFATVVRDPAEPTNTLLLGSDGPVTASRLLAGAAPLPDALQTLAAAAAPRLQPGLRGGDVYTDDKAPVEWLIDKSIVDYASGE